MEFRVIGQAADGEQIDEIMDGQSGQLLRTHLEQAGIEVISVRRVGPPESGPNQVASAPGKSPEDGVVFLLTIFGGMFNALALIAVLVSIAAWPAILWGIFFLIAGFGCWILAAIRTAVFNLKHSSNRQETTPKTTFISPPPGPIEP